MSERADDATGAMDESSLRQPGVLAWLRLARVFQKVERASAAHLRTWGLTMAQFDVIAQLGAAEGCTQQELADRLLVTKGNISQLLDKAERGGLIVRCQQGRTKRLHLTEAGRRLRAAVVPAQERFVAEQIAALTPAEQRRLLALLRTLDRALE
jgi:DNA-binding MarR family transcriptional regulator